MRNLQSKLSHSLIAVVILVVILSLNLALSLPPAIVTLSSGGTIRYEPLPITSLHTEGRYIKDEDGNVVVLCGFNKQDFLDFPDGSWPKEGESVEAGQGNFRDEAVRQHMRHWRDFWHMNLVRFHLNMRWWRDNERVSPYTGETSNIGNRDAVIRTIEIALEEGMYVEIDFFQVDFGEEQQDLPWPSSLIPNKAAFVSFWVNDVIPYVRDYPNVIYELWNEAAGSMAEWFDGATQTINAIRADGDDHLILIQYLWCGELNFVRNWEEQGRPTQNIIFGIHNYRSEGSFQDNNNNPNTNDINWLRSYLWRTNGAPLTVQYPNTGTAQATERHRYPPTGSNYGEVLTELNGGQGYPVWVGEYAGVNMASDDDEYNYFVNNLQVYKEWGVGWAFYVWDGLGSLHYMAQRRTGKAFQPPNRGGQAMIDSLSSP